MGKGGNTVEVLDAFPEFTVEVGPLKIVVDDPDGLEFPDNFYSPRTEDFRATLRMIYEWLNDQGGVKTVLDWVRDIVGDTLNDTPGYGVTATIDQKAWDTAVLTLDNGWTFKAS